MLESDVRSDDGSDAGSDECGISLGADSDRSEDDDSYESDFVVQDSDVESHSDEVPCGARLGYMARLR